MTERVDVHVETPCEAVVICERTSRAPGTIPSTMHGFRRWRIYGNELASVGFWYRPTEDANNEHAEFHANTIYGVKYPFVLEGQQSKHHRLTHNVVEGYAVAVQASSAFHWSGGTIAVGLCAFQLMRVGDPVTIADVGVEATGRLLITPGPATDAQPVVLQSVRFAADQLHDDGAMIVMRHAGPLMIMGGAFGDGAQRTPHIQLAGIGEQAVTIIGAKFGSFGADKVDPIRTNPGVRYRYDVSGCTYERAAGSPEHTATVLSP